MKQFIELTKEKLGYLKHKEHCFISFAEGGAMGCPGEVQVITAGGYAYSFNLILGDIRWDVATEVLPALGKALQVPYAPLNT